MANSTPPIPQDPIGENFKWRDWFQKLSNKVFGSLSEQDANNVTVTGGSLSGVTVNSGTLNNCNINGGTITGVDFKGNYHVSSIVLDTPLAITSGGTGATTAADARTNLGLGSGLTVVITTAKLTPTGSNGNMHFTNGILTSQTQAT
jgi:hypothetical protein